MVSRRRTEPEPVKTTVRRGRPATTPEQRENELIALAYDVAERQMREGTASSQVITQFLKAGSSRETIEQERLRAQVALDQAKIENMQSHQRMEELYKDAINAMQRYSPERPASMEEEDY